MATKCKGKMKQSKIKIPLDWSRRQYWCPRQNNPIRNKWNRGHIDCRTTNGPIYHHQWWFKWKISSPQWNKSTSHQGLEIDTQDTKTSKDYTHGPLPSTSHTTQCQKNCRCCLHINLRWKWGEHMWWINPQYKNTRGGSTKMLKATSNKTMAHTIEGQHLKPQYWQPATKQLVWTTINK